MFDSPRTLSIPIHLTFSSGQVRSRQGHANGQAEAEPGISRGSGGEGGFQERGLKVNGLFSSTYIVILSAYLYNMHPISLSSYTPLKR